MGTLINSSKPNTETMFKHVTKRGGREGSSGSDSGSESGSDGRAAAVEEGLEEFTGFGEEEDELEELDEDEDEDDDDDDDEELAEGGGEASFAVEDGDDDDDEEVELPANLPTLKEAVHNPVFELSADAKGRKTLVCICCPDKVLREGTMKDVHLASSSHRRRHDRYRSYLKKNIATISQETADPRQVSAFLDRELRLKKSGGAGFILNPSGKKRKRRRNKKSGDKEGADGDKAEAKKAEDAADGISEVSSGKAMNAKQRRQASQKEREAAESKGEGDKSNDSSTSAADSKKRKATDGAAAAKKVKTEDGVPAGKKVKNEDGPKPAGSSSSAASTTRPVKQEKTGTRPALAKGASAGVARQSAPARRGKPVRK